MDGLLSARVNPICLHGSRLHCPIVQNFSNCSLKTLYKYPLQIRKRHTHTLIGMTTADQSLEASTLARFNNILPSQEVLEVWRKADAVCFDVDSTVCLDEGNDKLAEFCGAGKAVAEWTVRAMNGSIPFEEALAARLSLFNPSLYRLQEFLEKRPPRISPGIKELIIKLKINNTDVYLVSGAHLGIPFENIFANQLLFGSSGEFVGFDKNEPTSKSGGKATAVQNIRKARGYKTVIMIGDGATDLEIGSKYPSKGWLLLRVLENATLLGLCILHSLPANAAMTKARIPGGADLFICYAGLETVAGEADWLVLHFEDLIKSLG